MSAPDPGPLGALAGPLAFAARSGFAGVDRLKGFEPLVRARVALARQAGEPSELLEGLEAAVAGFEDRDRAGRVEAVRAIAALLAGRVSLPPEAAALAGAAPEPSLVQAAPVPTGSAALPGPLDEPPAVSPPLGGDAPRALPVRPAPGSREGTPGGSPTASEAGGGRAPGGFPGGTPTPPGGDLPRDAMSRDPVLDGPLTQLPKVGPARAATYAARGIHTVRDLLWLLPVSWEKRTLAAAIGEVEAGTRTTVVGTVLSSRQRTGRKGRRILEVMVGDGGGRLRVTFFRSVHWAARKLPEGAEVALSGTVKRGYGGGLEMAHPEILDPRALPEGDAEGDEIRARYTAIDGVHPKAHREIVAAALAVADRVEDPLPPSVVESRRLMSPGNALRMLHEPPASLGAEALNEGQTEAHRRLIFDEFFFLQLGLALKARGVKVEPGIAFDLDEADVREALALLPFAPTGAQRRVVEEIARDMARAEPMNRLLQGDVGSGKTAVAAVTLALAVGAGYQGAVMAPTELLAEQHHRTLSGFLTGAGMKVVLLTGRLGAAERREALASVARGDAAVVVGTHALIQETVAFKRLGLVIVDEQHRFGVRQRLDLLEKGVRPDALVMTATPIPRTLAMTAYGDLDLSVLDEMPPGRTPVETRVYGASERGQVEAAIRREVGQGHQAYVVYPLIEASETLEDVRAATDMFESLGTEVFPDLRLGLLHGRMATADKDAVMRRFAAGEVDVLVATTVIEVGIDVPNASVMVVEHAERFGLSQLHQLRGRVGRGAARSYCLLVAEDARGERVRERLSVMEATTDGFRIAEEDLRIRGPGELLGTRQSGHPDLLFGNLARDRALLAQARVDAFDLLDADPELMRVPETRDEVARRWQQRVSLGRVG